MAHRLDRAADRFYRTIQSSAPRPLLARLRAAFDDFTVRCFMLKPNPDGAYDYLVQRWREQGRL